MPGSARRPARRGAAGRSGSTDPFPGAAPRPGSLRVRVEDAAARLSTLPARLPSPPPSLVSVRVDGGSPSFPPLDPATVRDAAVLVLLVPDHAGDGAVVLTERVARGGHHSGEVSFPGGRAEPGDNGPEGTALREAGEEIGLDPTAAGVRVLGRLDSFWIPVSNFRVTPVIAVAEHRPVLVPAETEVARIVLAPVRSFLPDAEIVTVEAVVRDWPIRYGAYVVEDLRVWGATARILGQLGALLGT